MESSIVESVKMTVKSRPAKPIQPNVLRLNLSMRSKSVLEMVRAWSAKSRAQRRRSAIFSSVIPGMEQKFSVRR